MFQEQNMFLDNQFISAILKSSGRAEKAVISADLSKSVLVSQFSYQLQFHLIIAAIQINLNVIIVTLFMISAL